MHEMEHLLAHAQWSQLAEIAHSLRGSSASMGFPRVADYCKDLELAARKIKGNMELDARTQESLENYVTLIKFHYEEADAALREWLANAPSPGAR